MTQMKAWLSHQAKERERLYEQYGKPLEERHAGEYLAIGSDGETVLGKDEGQVLKQAIKNLGSGNFAFVRVGSPTYGQWLSAGK